MTAKEMVHAIKAYISASGYRCSEGLIENFYLGLKGKAFVMLAGSSAVEKYRLGELFAQTVGATAANGRYKLLQVRPDWLAPSDLFGRVNLEGVFLPGAVIDFVKQAQDDSAKPYFLCLSGINLSSVEYYLSDVVRGLENRTAPEKQPLLTEKYYGPDQDAARKYGTLYVPENLYVIGTVNMDEASYPLNQRFLDRVHTMEVTKDDLVLEKADTKPQPLDVSNDAFLPRYLQIEREGEHWDFVLKCFAIFQRINSILVKARAYIEYTLRDDVILYLLHNLQEDIMPENMAMDIAIIQKVLPRVQGSGKAVGQTLSALFAYCADRPEEAAALSAEMYTAAQAPSCKYPKTVGKLAVMAEQLEKDNFAALWM